MPKLATKYTCTGCMVCQDRCPTKAIFCVYGNDGHRYIKINPEECIECKACEKTCPVINNESYGNNTLKSSFFAGWSQNSDLRNNAATAGVFGTIAKSFIEDGGWVAGAIMEGIECKYLLTNSIKDISRLQGSKYTSSNPSNIYNEVTNILKTGNKVLFSGLPCHVAAILSFIPISLHNNLYTIDLICGGVSSPGLIKKFVEEYPEVESIISFRNKLHGWKPTGYRYSLTYKLESGQIISESTSSKNLITDGFACELTDRYSCYDCQFTGINRKSDITIGDLWRDKLFPEQHYNGVSSIIVHSSKGLKLLDHASLSYTAIDAINVLKSNHRLYNGKSIKRYFPERKILGRCLKHLPYKVLLRIYAGNLKTKNCLWWPLALYRLVSFKLSNFLNNRKNRKILNNL